jgi:hypothetical protein
MPGLVPGIDVLASVGTGKTWMAATNPAPTKSDHSFAGCSNERNKTWQQDLATRLGKSVAS